jgi:hypothetical protein
VTNDLRINSSTRDQEKTRPENLRNEKADDQPTFLQSHLPGNRASGDSCRNGRVVSASRSRRAGAFFNAGSGLSVESRGNDGSICGRTGGQNHLVENHVPGRTYHPAPVPDLCPGLHSSPEMVDPAQHRLPIQPTNPDHFVCSYK